MSAARLVALVAAPLVLAACERTFRDMYDQPRYKPLAASSLWNDGRSSRAPVDGTIAHASGVAADATGGQAIGDAQDDRASPATPQTLARGRERFDIFCSPCHGIAGDGDGMIARRGFPHPPSFHTERLRAASDAHLFAVITDGYGAMYPYGTRVGPSDRVAIVAYVRALQLSQNAPIGAVPQAERARLLLEGGAGRTAEPGR